MGLTSHMVAAVVLLDTHLAVWTFLGHFQYCLLGRGFFLFLPRSIGFLGVCSFFAGETLVPCTFAEDTMTVCTGFTFENRHVITTLMDLTG